MEQVQAQTRNIVLDVMKIKETTSEQAERIMAMEKMITNMAKESASECDQTTRMEKLLRKVAKQLNISDADHEGRVM
jgi:hypothetical protein